MQFSETRIPGVYIIEPRVFTDERGAFIKIFHKEEFQNHGLACEFKESFYSISQKGVIRGMHFQTPPHEHAKLIYVTREAIRDVIVDIRRGSPAYGEYVSVELSEENRKMLYVPAGCAHGFSALQDGACVIYSLTSVYAEDHDKGIRYDSFGFDWGRIEAPIVSLRDQGFPPLKDFQSPFRYGGSS